MKNNPIKNLNKPVMIVTAIILLLSCQQQGEPYNLPTGSTHIKLSVSASNSGTTVDNNDPASAIKSLCILQFYAEGSNFGKLRHVGIGKEVTPNSGQYSATLLQSNSGISLWYLPTFLMVTVSFRGWQARVTAKCNSHA